MEIRDAFRILLSDKFAKPEIRARTSVSLAGLMKDSLHPLFVEPNTPEPCQPRSPTSDSINGELGRLSLREVCKRFNVEFDFEKFGSMVINYSWNGDSETTTLAQFVEMVRTSVMKPRVVAVCRALMRGDRHLLVVILAAIRCGRITVHPQIESQVVVFAIQTILTMNATDTAYREGTALLSDEEATAVLSEGEIERLQSLVCKAAARSGRPSVAFDMCRRLFAEEPQNAERFRNLLTVASASDPEMTAALCDPAAYAGLQLAVNDKILIAALVLANGRVAQAVDLLQPLMEGSEATPDVFAGWANVGRHLDDETLWAAALKQLFEMQDVPVVVDLDAPIRPFAFSAPGPSANSVGGPLVTVVMTTHNSADTVVAAVRSVMAQTWRDWQLIIVDDASTDETPAIIAELAGHDSRIQYVYRTGNSGTYVSKNAGMERAEGTFITFHDSDDWMHPRRLETHVASMDQEAECSTSNWIRMEHDGLVVLRRGGRYLHLNPASTFYRRSTIQTVGGFHPVRSGADTELYYRVRATFGARSIRQLDRCLGIGFQHQNSLTSHGPTAYDEYRYSPPRLAYAESWLRWHVTRLAKGLSVAHPAGADVPFRVPESIRC
jgi:hypothetical protein